MKNRTQRLNFFLVVWLTMFSFSSSRAQIFFAKPENRKFSSHKLLESIDFGKVRITTFLMVKPSEKPPADIGNDIRYLLKPESTYRQVSYNQPADLYYLNSGYFCKREWELEKMTHVPFRFRIGSLANCDALEGKH